VRPIASLHVCVKKIMKKYLNKIEEDLISEKVKFLQNIPLFR